MNITRHIYATRESMVKGFSVGSIKIEINDGMGVYVNFLHDVATIYHIVIDNAYLIERENMYDACYCVIHTIYEHYVDGCLFADTIDDDFPMTRTEFYARLPVSNIKQSEMYEGDRQGTLVKDGNTYTFVVNWPPKSELGY